MSENYFAEMNKIDVSKHVEKKGRFSYLSWPFAVQELGKADPGATWEVIHFNGIPYCESKAGCFVEVSVTCNGVKKTQVHPVLDNNNRTIESPNAFQINTSIQRALVKAISLHGLGLYIYAGEDLPDTGDEPKAPPGSAKRVMQDEYDALDNAQKEKVDEAVILVAEYFEAEDVNGAKAYLERLALSNEEKLGLWSKLPSNQRSALKKAA